MSFRKFRDRDGNGWEVRDESDRRWVFRPLRGNDRAEVSATPPPRTDDPFELSAQELQAMLDGGLSSGTARGGSAGGRGSHAAGGARRPASPFKDDLD